MIVYIDSEDTRDSDVRKKAPSNKELSYICSAFWLQCSCMLKKKNYLCKGTCRFNLFLPLFSLSFGGCSVQCITANMGCCWQTGALTNNHTIPGKIGVFESQLFEIRSVLRLYEYMWGCVWQRLEVWKLPSHWGLESNQVILNMRKIPWTIFLKIKFSKAHQWHQNLPYLWK